MPTETKTAATRRKRTTEADTPETDKKTASKTATTMKVAAAKVATATAKATTKAAPAKTTKPEGAAKATKPIAKKAAVPRKSKVTGQPITADARLRHIEIAAYYIAEKSGFSRNPRDCWVAAESEIDSLLLAGKLSG